MYEVMEMSDRMKGMKLGNFSGIKKTQPEPSKPPEQTPEPKTEPEVKKTKAKPAKTTKSKAKVVKKTKAKEQLVTVNIKIRKDQKAWLTDTASTVRNNNSDPVPPSERVYPQHLIGVAIDLLQNMDVDWDEVKNVEELRELLKI